MMECNFCKIVSGILPSYKIYEDKNTLAFAPLKEDIISPRHLVLIPKNHYNDIYDISKEELIHIILATKTIAQKLKERYKAEGINILHASGQAAQQSSFHFHLHLIPRYEDDGLDTWPNTGYKENDFPNIYEEMLNL